MHVVFELLKDFHNQHISHVVKAFLDYLFYKKGARRIYAYTEDYNKSSQHLCEKLGMRKEAEYIEFISFVNNPDGTPKYENTFEYAILKKEWDKKNEKC